MLSLYQEAVLNQGIEWSGQHDFLCSNPLAVQHAYYIDFMENYSKI